MSFEIAKAGWLNRESSILRRWKRNWFVLYQDGTLRYFESPESHTAEEAIRLRPECVQVKAGSQVEDVTPPVGKTRSCLLALLLRDKTLNLCAESPDDMITWQLCLEEARIIAPRPQQTHSAPPPYSPHPGAVHYNAADSASGAGQYPPQQAPPYPTQGTPYPTQGTPYPTQGTAYAYPGQVVYGSDQSMYVVPPNQTTVIYTDDGCHYGHHGYCGRRYRRRSCDGGDVAMGMMAGAAVGSMMWMPLMWW